MFYVLFFLIVIILLMSLLQPPSQPLPSQTQVSNQNRSSKRPGQGRKVGSKKFAIAEEISFLQTALDQPRAPIGRDLWSITAQIHEQQFGRKRSGDSLKSRYHKLLKDAHEPRSLPNGNRQGSRAHELALQLSERIVQFSEGRVLGMPNSRMSQAAARNENPHDVMADEESEYDEVKEIQMPPLADVESEELSDSIDSHNRADVVEESKDPVDHIPQGLSASPSNVSQPQPSSSSSPSSLTESRTKWRKGSSRVTNKLISSIVDEMRQSDLTSYKILKTMKTMATSLAAESATNRHLAMHIMNTLVTIMPRPQPPVQVSAPISMSENISQYEAYRRHLLRQAEHQRDVALQSQR